MGACLCCVACGCCTVLVLAVMIPLGIFVIGPKMAQHMMDNTVVTLHNSSVVPKGGADLAIGQLANMYVNSTINTPGPFSLTTEAYTATLSANVVTSAFNTTDKFVELGTFVFPSMHLDKGNNQEIFSTDFNISNTGIPIALVMAGFGGPPVAPFPVRITATAVAKAFGLTFHPRQEVNLNCTMLPNPDGGSLAMVSMRCEPPTQKDDVAFSMTVGITV